MTESVEWYTPLHILEAVYNTLGTLDLDPCCNTIGAPNVKAANYYREADNGLAHAWEGNVFLNPPYGRGIGEWVKKAVGHYKNNDITAILLLPAKTDTGYWHDLSKHAPLWCAIKGRISFISPHGQTNNCGKFPSAAVLLTTNREYQQAFYKEFSQLGEIYTRFTP